MPYTFSNRLPDPDYKIRYSDQKILADYDSLFRL